MHTVPKQVMVGGKKIKVIVKPEMEDWACYYHDLGEIHISEKLLKTPDKLAHYFRHELVHAAFGVSGLAFIPDFPEEAIVRCLDGIFFPACERMLSLLNHPAASPPPTSKTKPLITDKL